VLPPKKKRNEEEEEEEEGRRRRTRINAETNGKFGIAFFAFGATGTFLVLSAFDPLCIRRKGVLGPRALSIIRSLCANQHYSKVCCFQLMLL
jgi:hypothetical protein